jgi:cell wall hydrolase
VKVVLPLAKQTIDEKQKAADLAFLALTIWREARGETDEVRTAVAYSILTRVQRPCWWGNDIMSVVFKKWQYSSMTNPHDAQLVAWPVTGSASWIGCLEIADRVSGGTIPNPAAGADSYYDISRPAPAWATPDSFVKAIGKLRFYRVRAPVPNYDSERSEESRTVPTICGQGSNSERTVWNGPRIRDPFAASSPIILTRFFGLLRVTTIYFLLRYLGDLKHLSLGQWISVVGSGVTAFGVAMASDPHHLEVACIAAAGTLVVAIVHVLQPSPAPPNMKS